MARIGSRLKLDSNTLCGAPGSTTAITNNEDLMSINNCTILQGSLYVQAEVNPVDASLNLPSTLHTITGGLVCNGSNLQNSPTTIHAPALTTIASDQNDTSVLTVLGFAITNYINLTTLSFPNLIQVGSDFIVTKNPVLRNMEGFPSLETVQGSIQISGMIYSLEFPNLDSVKGNVDIESSATNFTCPVLNLQGSVEAHGGNFTCVGNVTQTNTNQSTSATVGVPSPSSFKSAAHKKAEIHSKSLSQLR